MTVDETIAELERVKRKFKKEHPIVGVGVLRIDLMADDCIMNLKEQKQEIEELKERLKLYEDNGKDE